MPNVADYPACEVPLRRVEEEDQVGVATGLAWTTWARAAHHRGRADAGKAR